MLITTNEILYNEVKALTWKQPFASMMKFGKQETRSRQSHYKGLVLICAGKQAYTDKALYDLAGGENIRAMKNIFAANNEPTLLGQAIAIGRQTSCGQMIDQLNYKMLEGKTFDEASTQIQNETFVKYYHDLFIWQYADVVPIVPFAWQGTQGWTTLTFEQKKQIKLITEPDFKF